MRCPGAAADPVPAERALVGQCSLTCELLSRGRLLPTEAQIERHDEGPLPVGQAREDIEVGRWISVAVGSALPLPRALQNVCEQAFVLCKTVLRQTNWQGSRCSPMVMAAGRTHEGQVLGSLSS
jgi:hypothetical protein